ncbi:MAG: RIP metalloprotease RseP [Bacillota bacterium]|nr:RIP metalloprotease RseP [Bacillota bacterium]
MRIIGIILAILLFVVLVVIHEFGHFITAKLCGVNVLEFSVGIGPVLYKKEKGGTQYSLRSIPIGGYCRLEGELAEGEDGASNNDEKSYMNAAWYKKILICIAGAFNNILLCLIVLFFIFLYMGSGSQTLGAVTPGSPADLAGLKAEDKIIAIDDVKMTSWNEIVNTITNSNGDLEITFERDGNENSAILSPEYDEELGRKIVGITTKMVHSPSVSAKASVQTSVSFFVEIKDTLIRLVTGKESADNVVGIVGIVDVVSQEIEYGLVNVFYIMALISLNLGVVNLLPIPGLDGGKILFILFKTISGGRISDNVEATVDTIGLLILMALAILLIFKDTMNLVIR